MNAEERTQRRLAAVFAADRATECIARAKRLSPHDPQDVSIQLAMAFAHFIAGRYGESLACAQAVVRVRPNLQLVNCLAAASAGNECWIEKIVA